MNEDAIPRTASPHGDVSPPTTDDPDLRDSLIGLSRLATSQVPLSALLTDVAVFAARAVPAADGAGLTLLVTDRPQIVVTTADFVRRVDEIQYRLNEGPCVTAARETRVVRSGNLADDPTWPRFGTRVGRLGVHSALAVPLIAGEDVVAAINIYAHGSDAFDDRAAEFAVTYARSAAVAVQTAKALADARTLAAQLRQALTTRAVIDQAIGILMSQIGCSDTEAFDKLRRMSQSQNRRVSLVAATLRDEAVRQARRAAGGAAGQHPQHGADPRPG